ncbi:unnamed protein product [Mytilus coruscus]|uniref:C3H1-type domain-containing protein n=1 Tax=Mytilus coruscus TaxID=42192 RepID=A0A6J8EWX0_MYTCO|nr:unnamed protein product [Mytilus coruscus]
MSWATVDKERWLLYIHAVLSNTPSPGVYMVNTNRKCYEFNNKGTCMLPQCRYLHKCLRCNGAHPAINCRVPQYVAGSRMGNFRPCNRSNFRQTGRGTDADESSGQQEHKSVWVVGSSIVKNAFIEAKRSYDGCSLGLHRKNYRVWWQGKGGMKWGSLY